MKIAPIIRAIDSHNQSAADPIHYRLVHTGQHYDDKLSHIFFQELGLPQPNVNLGAGSGTQAEQTARIMIEFEKDLLANPTDLVIVVGDVTSTLACTIVAKKLNTLVAHVEGGIRSFDMTMPEEINRLVTDSIADYFFTTSEVANQNLRNAGVAQERIHFVGNTMIDSLYASMEKLRVPEIWHTLNLQPGKYYVLTLHRPSNVDAEERLREILLTIDRAAGEKPIVFPVHPRTRKNFQRIAPELDRIHAIDPMGYFEFVYLLKHAAGVVTDSGGVQEETTVLGIPCVTLRKNTERPETITLGTNELIGEETARLPEVLQTIESGKWKAGAIPPLWDGKTAERLVKILKSILEQK